MSLAICSDCVDGRILPPSVLHLVVGWEVGGRGGVGRQLRDTVVGTVPVFYGKVFSAVQCPCWIEHGFDS